MTLGRARRARARALVVPVVMSAPMWLVAGELVLGWCDPVRQLGRYGPAALTLVVVAVLAAAADTGPMERWLARVFLKARAPRLHQRHALAPVAEVLLRHGVPPQWLELLVGPGRQVGVTALGRRTVVASRGLIEAVWSGQPGPEQAAAVITHEVGVMRSKLTRHDLAMMVLLAPWKVCVPCQVLGRFSGSGKLGVPGSDRRRCTSRGRFQDRASCGRTALNSTRKSSP